MHPDIIYAKLKNEVIQVDQYAFAGAINAIKSETADKSDLLSLLESAMDDEDGKIRTLIANKNEPNWHENVSETYKSLIENQKAAFASNVSLKFSKTDTEGLKKQPAELRIDFESGQIIPISEIKIPYFQKEKLPKGIKLGRSFDYYKRTGQFLGGQEEKSLVRNRDFIP